MGEPHANITVRCTWLTNGHRRVTVWSRSHVTGTSQVSDDQVGWAGGAPTHPGPLPHHTVSPVTREHVASWVVSDTYKYATHSTGGQCRHRVTNVTQARPRQTPYTICTLSVNGEGERGWGSRSAENRKVRSGEGNKNLQT